MYIIKKYYDDHKVIVPSTIISTIYTHTQTCCCHTNIDIIAMVSNNVCQLLAHM